MEKKCQHFCFCVVLCCVECYIYKITAMKNFKKDRLLLFRALQNLVTENLKYSNVNVYDDADVAEVVIELRDKKRQRLLKKLSNAMTDLVDEFVKEQKLRKQESDHNQEEMRKAVSNVSERFNSV